MIVFLGWTADYDRVMIKSLSEILNVKSIVFPEGKIIFQINKRTNYFLMRMFLRVWSFFIKPDSILIYKDSDGYGYHKHLDLFEHKKILIIRNIISSQTAERFLEQYDIIYSFDKAQCDKYDFRYMEQIFPLCKVKNNQYKISECCYFIGLDKNRAKIIESVGDVLVDYNILCDFNIIKDETSLANSKYYVRKGICYSENIYRTQRVKYILEINQVGQSGVTLRALEAIFFGRKLISNNLALKSYDFYDSSRIFIFSEVNDLKTESFIEFLSSPYKPISEHLLTKYKSSTFFKFIIECHG
ncbi:hypothetical protein H0I54_18030 [Yersinia kristensenii]|uniref:hypothetical protein n=1 Tax=Yersinia kristensenii TaxID=28152 RepID=UPI001C60A2C0|nr:hypothetical protein [Yersinia kristensenii]MBW5810711.1 hypothetical protein [Yersinia kristensenii]MBW5817865.1 hypothetical protein [Yersinia kristensenii]MBW5827858.1 hypothetical protein [Yersinia kristensenii]MBW5843700.1 hypothetical protein [Yersinia kristensenii]MDA5487467.1 hypothetical protein [Yersinia kristensenii]